MLHRFNLTALLAALAILDLVLDRIFTRLFLAERATAGGAARALAHIGAHISNLCAALAILLFASTFISLIRRRELYPRPLRAVASILAAIFVLLLAACVSSIQVPGRWIVQLTTTHAFAIWLIAMAVWSAPVAVRARLGVTLFALPSVLHTAALFLSQTGRSAGLAGDLARAGELAAFIAAGAAPLLLLPLSRPARHFGLAWALGAAAAAVLMAALILRFDLVHVLALYGLRLDLPRLGSASGWAYAILMGLAVLGSFLVVVPAFAAGGSERLLAYGVILVVAAGYQPSSPADLGVSACGMLSLALGVTRRQFSSQTTTPAPLPAPVPAPAG